MPDVNKRDSCFNTSRQTGVLHGNVDRTGGFVEKGDGGAAVQHRPMQQTWNYIIASTAPTVRTDATGGVQTQRAAPHHR